MSLLCMFKLVSYPWLSIDETTLYLMADGALSGPSNVLPAFDIQNRSFFNISMSNGPYNTPKTSEAMYASSSLAGESLSWAASPWEGLGGMVTFSKLRSHVRSHLPWRGLYLDHASFPLDQNQCYIRTKCGCKRNKLQCHEWPGHCILQHLQ